MNDASLHDYPVDPAGPAGRRPDPAWPGGRAVAVQFSILAADPLALSPGGDVPAAADAPEQAIERARRAGTRLPRDLAYGSRVGLHRLHAALRGAGLPATWFFAASLAERLPGLVRELVAEGHEIALFGDAADLAAGPAAVAALRQRLAAASGLPPVGWRSRRRHPDGRKVLRRAGGFVYDGDAADDDLPYWHAAGGGRLLVLPAVPLAGRTAAALAGALACARDEGADRPQLLRLELRPDRIGRPDAAAGLPQALAGLANHDDLWVATASAIAAHWAARFPFSWLPAGEGAPTRP
ncbi:MAG: hypothetical protein RIB84_07130 [Sneathiellaceae bacterium]